MKNLLFFLLLGGLLAAGCREDDVVDCDDFTNPACSNYNPCHDQKEVSAEFLAHIHVSFNQHSHHSDKTLTSDTFGTGQRITFFALDTEADYYEWKIGTDDRTWNTPDVTLLFADEDSAALTSGITVQLIVKKKPNATCFPNDDGIDTFTRRIVFLAPYDDRPYLGTWRGYNSSNTTHVYDVEIGRHFKWGELRYHVKNLSGANYDCFRYEMPGIADAYRSFYSNEAFGEVGHPCPSSFVYPFAEVNTINNSIKISFEGIIFKGKKI